MKRTITALALSAIVVLGMTACSSEQTPEPPVRSDAPSTSAPASPAPSETETDVETARPEPSGEFSIDPAVIAETNEFGLVWQSSGSPFDISGARFDLPADAVTLWGEDRAKEANLVAMEAVFAGNFLISAFEDGTDVRVARYEAVTDLMTPAAVARFNEALAGDDPDNLIYGIAPEGTYASGDASYGETVVHFDAESTAEVKWDGTWTSELVSDASIYGDSETRYLVTLTYDIVYAGVDDAGAPASLIETRTQWLALLPVADSWGLDRWGYGSEVSEG